LQGSIVTLQGGHFSGKPGKVRESSSSSSYLIGIEKCSGKIGKIREKSGTMNYYSYSVATIIVQTIIGDHNNSTIDHSQLIF